MPEDKIPGEIHSKAAAAAEAVYRLSGLKNFDGALKFGLRMRSTEILRRLAALAVSSGKRRSEEAAEILSDIAAVQELIRFAAGRFCITPANAEKVLSAYRNVGEGIRELASAGGAAAEENAGPAPRNNRAKTVDLNERQRRILECLGANGRAQFSDIRKFFGDDTSGRTLQRDIWQLVEAGLIRRIGDKRGAVYVAYQS